MPWPLGRESGERKLKMTCTQQAVFRYTWAGRDESYCCVEHAQQLQAVARAMSYYVQLIPLSGDEQMNVSCSQEVRPNTGMKPAVNLILERG
jgi:hypothetical protein